MPFLNRLALIITSLTSSKRLRPYENVILNGWRNSLDPATRLLLDKQLAKVKFVQRQAGDTKVVFYYDGLGGDCEFSNLSPDLHAATVVLSQGAIKLDSNLLKSDIFVHRGKLNSIEFSEGFDKIIKHLESKDFDIYSVINYSSLN
jgi:hypothetical protein